MGKRPTALFLALAPVSFGTILLSILKEDLPLANLYTSAGFALLAFESTFHLVPILSPLFVQRNLKGKDRLKLDGPEMWAFILYATSNRLKLHSSQIAQKAWA